MDKVMEKYGKNIPAMRTIFKPPEGIFFLMLTNSFGSKSQKDIVLSVGCCLPKPACFPRRKICMYASE